MSLGDLMIEFATQVGLPGIELEDDGGGRIVLGDDIEIDIFADEDGPGFLVIGVVGALPSSDREVAFFEMLAANGQGLATGGDCLGLDAHREEILLRRHFPTANVPVDLFDRELAAFAVELEAWRMRSQNGKLGAAEGAENADGEAAGAAGPPPGILV